MSDGGDPGSWGSPHSSVFGRDIYVINADGTGERRLTHSAAAEIAPVWSPAAS
jgi:Tol biopolymer transport system component